MTESSSMTAARSWRDVALTLDSAVQTVANALARIEHSLPCLSRLHGLGTPSVQLCVVLSTVALARVGFRVCCGKGGALTRRALLLRRVCAVVERWEAVLVDEVCTQCGEDLRRGRDEEGCTDAFLRSVIGDDEAVRALRRCWCDEASTRNVCSVSARDMASSFAFAADFALQDYLALCHVARRVLTLEYDRHWLYRLQCIVRYAVFRRLAMMDEVRCYRDLVRRVMLGSPSHVGDMVHAAWRVYGRPFWLVPYGMTSGRAEACAALSTRQQKRRHHYLCLPWSYFPVESVMTCQAERSWLRDLVERTLVPWRRESTVTLRASAATALRCTRATEDERWSTVQTVWSRVDYWFLRYACPLARCQVRERRTATRAFIAQHLLPSQPGCGGLSRPGFRVSLAALVAVHVVDCAAQTLTPRLDIEAVLFTALGATSCGTESCDGLAAAPSRLARRLLRRLLLALLAEVVTRTVRRLGPALLAAPLRARVADALRRALTAQVLHSVATADEAFLARLVDLGDSGPSQTSPTLIFPPASSSSPLARPAAPLPRRHSVAHLVQEADYAAQLMLDYVHATVRCATQLVCLLAMLCYHRGEADWRLLPLSVLFLPLVEMRVTAWLIRGLGGGEDEHVERYMRGLSDATGVGGEDGVVATPLHGLRLLRCVLVERAASSALPWCGSRALASPYLALLVCGVIDSHGDIYGAAVNDTEGGVCALKATQRLCKAVLRHPFTEQLPRRRPHWWLSTQSNDTTRPSRVQHVVRAMQRGVECVLQTRLRDAKAAFVRRRQLMHRARTPPAARADACAAQRTPELHPWLDETEMRILQSPSALRVLPAPMDFFVLFALPTRSILRHLGLEVVCGYRTAMAQGDGTAQRTRDKLEELLVRGAVADPLERLVCNVVPCIRTLLVVAVLATEWRQGELYVRPSAVASSAMLWGVVARLRTYAVLLGSCGGVVQAWCSSTTMDEYGMTTLDTLRAVQQLCTSLPATISDAAPLSAPPALVARRQAWRTYLGRDEVRCSSLVFDAAGRVTGGLRMRDGLAMHHVYFAYPRLHHTDTAMRADAADGGGAAVRLRPTLIDCSLRLPAAQMTAVIGETGAGKSSLARLLTRLYDPLPLVAIDWPPTSHATHDGTGMCERWTEAVLEHVLWLQYVEHPLPPPPSSRLSSPPQHSDVACEAHVMRDGTRVQLLRGGVWFDEVPLALLSVTYLRRWLLQLTQYTPAALLPTTTVVDNVRFLDPDVSRDDALRAATLCECDAFVTRRHGLGYDATLGGALSAGEGQRVLLARVLAAAMARLRRTAHHRDSGTSLAAVTRPTSSTDGTVAAVGRCGACAGLLLDEPTSRLDAENEAKVMGVLQDLARHDVREAASCDGASASVVVPRMTVVVIAHRMSTLKAAQHMVVLEKGHVTAQGTPHEVCETNAFASLQRRLQTLPTVA